MKIVLSLNSHTHLKSSLNLVKSFWCLYFLIHKFPTILIRLANLVIHIIFSLVTTLPDKWHLFVGFEFRFHALPAQRMFCSCSRISPTILNSNIWNDNSWQQRGYFCTHWVGVVYITTVMTLVALTTISTLSPIILRARITPLESQNKMSEFWSVYLCW